MKKRLYELAIVKTPRVLEANDKGWSTIADASVAAHVIRAVIGKSPATEYFVVLHLDSRNKLIGYERYGGGCTASVQVEPSTIFRSALLSCARSIIVGHNHPSGDVLPSDDDINITYRISSAAKLLMIDFLDHIIVTDEEHYVIEMVRT